MAKTLRLTFPEWQGGMNPIYYLGSQILRAIAPVNAEHLEVEVPVRTDFNQEQIKENGFFAGKIIAEQQINAKSILKVHQPEKVIVFGGDCSVSQAPFDYLHGKYKEQFGVLWVDTHPDISTPVQFTNEHAMVLGNLLGEGAPELAALVENPLQSKQVFYAGLIVNEKMSAYEKDYLAKHQLAYLTAQELDQRVNEIVDWIEKNNFKYLAVHFDLDVLTSQDFYSLLYNKPYQGEVPYTTGQLKLQQVLTLLKLVEKHCQVVGLTFAEYTPWDMHNLQKFMQELEIFS